MWTCPLCRSAYVNQVEFCGVDGERLIETAADPLIGTTIDRYEIIELLGRGAMGSVYRARHTVLSRDFAMKMLFGDFAANRMFAARFRREAQALSKLHHTNIISVSDFGRTEQGLMFLVMDCLNGTTLARTIREEGPLNPWRAARITRQIAAGLAEAHRCGVVHRDVKPENVILVQEGDEEVVKLVDFGIVALEALDAEETRLTGIGRLVGTPTHMAPEQAKDGPITPATDLYSVGVVLFEMLEGTVPFEGSLPQLLHQHASCDPPPARPAAGLEALIPRLMAKRPSDRIAGANALIAEIDTLVLDWSGASGDLPITAAAPLARSLSNPGLHKLEAVPISTASLTADLIAPPIPQSTTPVDMASPAALMSTSVSAPIVPARALPWSPSFAALLVVLSLLLSVVAILLALSVS